MNRPERTDLLQLNRGLPIEVYEAAGDARHRLFATRTGEESAAVIDACLNARRATEEAERRRQAADELQADRLAYERLLAKYGGHDELGSRFGSMARATVGWARLFLRQGDLSQLKDYLGGIDNREHLVAVHQELVGTCVSQNLPRDLGELREAVFRDLTHTPAGSP